MRRTQVVPKNQENQAMLAGGSVRSQCFSSSLFAAYGSQSTRGEEGQLEGSSSEADGKASYLSAWGCLGKHWEGRARHYLYNACMCAVCMACDWINGGSAASQSPASTSLRVLVTAVIIVMLLRICT